MERLTKKSESGMVWFVDHENNDMRLEPCEMDSHHSRLAIQKLAEYEDLEDRLNGISIEQVVNGFIKTVENQTNEDYEHGRILTNADADKWNEYNHAEEQGLLKRFPCKVGDTVYAYCSEFGILPYTVDCIVIDEHITYQCSSYSEPIGDCPSECLDEIEPDISDFGKTVFLTQAEAEQKLKEMEKEK